MSLQLSIWQNPEELGRRVEQLLFCWALASTAAKFLKVNRILERVGAYSHPGAAVDRHAALLHAVELLERQVLDWLAEHHEAQLGSSFGERVEGKLALDCQRCAWEVVGPASIAGQIDRKVGGEADLRRVGQESHERPRQREVQT